MKITLAMVESVDGKITKGKEPNPHAWTSKEDQEHFASLVENSSLIIMGRKTFDAARGMIKLSPKTLRVILTKEPEKHKHLSVPGQLEFTNEDPRTLISRLETQGFTEALLAGGGEINSEFFKEKLVNELWLTVEPAIFGSGSDLVSEEELNIDLALENVERMNEKGTLLLKYKVNY